MKARYLLLNLIAAGSLAVTLAWYSTAAKEVSLEVDGQPRRITTRVATVGELLASQRVVLADKDRVEPPPDARLRDGMRVRVLRAGLVILKVGGEERVVYTVPVPVKELLAEQEISLGPEDEVEPGLEMVVAPGDTVQVRRVSTKEVVVREKIPFDVRRETLAHLPVGQTRVLQPGEYGLRERLIRVTYVNGRPVKREEIKSRVVRAPVTRVVGVGTRRSDVRLASRGSPEGYREVREMLATAYALHSITATGTRPRVGTVAVDPRVIPLGTRLYVEGYGYGRAEDVGSAIKGDRIDVYFNSESEARRWGKRRVKVYILD